MAHGGRRAGAGRRSDAEIQRIRALIDAAVTDVQWKRIIKALAKKAEKGDARAFQTLAAYRFGMPRQDLNVSGADVLILRLPENGMEAAPRPTDGVSRKRRV